MADYKSLLMEHLEQLDIKFTDLDEYVLRVSYTGDNLKTIPITIYFDEEGEPIVQMKCWSITSFKDEKFDSGVAVCNELNKRFRWVCFYLDDDCDVVAMLDAYFDEESCGSICTRLIHRMVSIIDEAYPTLMETLWSKKDDHGLYD